MPTKEKATGWKIPLLFCAAIVFIVAVGAFLIEIFRHDPEFPEDLLELAKAARVDLNAPENEKWRDAVFAAAAGFAPYDVKDKKLAEVVARALNEGKADAAVAAVTQMRGENTKNDNLEKIFLYVTKSCAETPLAPGLIKALTDADRAENLRRSLNEIWQNCRRETR